MLRASVGELVARPASGIVIHGRCETPLADVERMDLVTRNVAKAVRSAMLIRMERGQSRQPKPQTFSFLNQFAW